MISFWTPLLKWVFICGVTFGIGVGVPLGRHSVFVQMRVFARSRRLRWRNPLAWLAGEYRGIWRESDRLAAGFTESAPWITAGATPSQRADLCAVSVATEGAARHL